MNQTYTVFAKWPDGSVCIFPTLDGEPTGLMERIEFVANYRGGDYRGGDYYPAGTFTPVGWTTIRVGFSSVDQQYQMAIAAGRLIEKVDGKYIARGIHSPMMEAAPEEKLAPVKVCEEPKREPLDWNKPTSIDRFPGFSVTSGRDIEDRSYTTHTHSHPLQKMAEGKEGFGSAALLKVR